MPEERHEHFDKDGVYTGHTVVTRESEWDDSQRDRLLALLQYESEVCSCGFHKSLCDDRSNVFTFVTKHCSVVAGREQYARMLDERDKGELERRGENTPARTPRSSDGRTTFTRMLPPSEAAKLRGGASVAQ